MPIPFPLPSKAFFLGFGLLAILMLVGGLWTWKHLQVPSDDSVVRSFILAQPHLEKLSKMLAEEPAEIVGITTDRVMVGDWTKLVPVEKAGVKLDLFLQYQRLMKDAGVTQLWRNEEGIYFYFRRSGFASSGWRVLFLHSLNNVSPLVSSINVWPPADPSGGSRTFRPVGEHWYIVTIRL